MTPTTPTDTGTGRATGRIRWEGRPEISSAAYLGYVGTLDPDLFRIYAPDDRDDDWILASMLPGQSSLRHYSDNPDAPKAEAEKWLAEFTSSLGAIFPEDAYEFPHEDDMPLEVRFAAGTRVRFAYPDAGYPGEAEDAMKALTPGRVYTIAWADIGQSRTDLNLADRGRNLGRFNSVLFEPVDDPAPSPKTPVTETTDA